jgi:hypothetical protein
MYIACFQTPIEEKENGTDTDPLDIEAFLRGMASQAAEREDNIITEDLRGSHWKKLLSLLTLLTPISEICIHTNTVLLTAFDVVFIYVLCI